MIPVSGQFKDLVAGSHDAVVECDIEYNKRIVGTLPIISGGVSVDSKRQVRRTMAATLWDRNGTLTPKGAADLLNPTVGAILRPRRGVEKHTPVRVSQLFATSDAWHDGTLTDTVTTADGGLSLATAPTDAPPLYPGSDVYPGTDLYPEG